NRHAPVTHACAIARYPRSPPGWVGVGDGTGFGSAPRDRLPAASDLLSGSQPRRTLAGARPRGLRPRGGRHGDAAVAEGARAGQALSFSRSRSFTTCGLALPPVSRITCPTKNPSRPSLPPRYALTCDSFSPRT